jgi:hypothetical protein
VVALSPAAILARAISVHHQEHQPCVGPRRATRHGFVRERCEVERRLFAELAEAQERGWPA